MFKYNYCYSVSKFLTENIPGKWSPYEIQGQFDRELPVLIQIPFYLYRPFYYIKKCNYTLCVRLRADGIKKGNCFYGSQV